MKKTIVALAVAAFAATAANAATVFEKDGTKVEVSGKAKVLLVKDSNKRLDLQNDDSEVTFAASHKVAEGLTALASTTVKLGQNDFADEGVNESVFLDSLYAGFEYEGVGQVTFGRKTTIGDDLGVAGYSYKLDPNAVYLVTEGNKVLSFRTADFNGFTAGLDYVFDPVNGKASNSVNNKAWVLGATYANEFAGVGVRFDAGFSKETKGSKPSQKFAEKAFLVGGEVSYAGFSFGIDVGQKKLTSGAYINRVVFEGEDNAASRARFVQDLAAFGAKIKVGADDVADGQKDITAVEARDFNSAVGGSALKADDKVTVHTNKFNSVRLGLKYEIDPKAAVYATYGWETAKGYADLALHTDTKGAIVATLDDTNDLDKVLAANGTPRTSYKAKKVSYSLGASYLLHKQVETFVELGKETLKATSFEDAKSDNKVRVGLRVMF